MALTRQSTTQIYEDSIQVSEKKYDVLTIVSVHTAFSMSQILIVESNPALYARLLADSVNTALDTLPVWLLSTLRGAFRLAFEALSFAFFRRFFLSGPSSTGTSSAEGTMVSQTPIKLSQEAVRRCDPEELDAMEDTGAVCRWREANVSALGLPELLSAKVVLVIRAVRSCEALATR